MLHEGPAFRDRLERRLELAALLVTIELRAELALGGMVERRVEPALPGMVELSS
jgi:hypothetical protein